MSDLRVTQQITSPALPLSTPRAAAREAPGPATVSLPGSGALQWLLDGYGWRVMRPAFDLIALCSAAIVSLGGLPATLAVQAREAPLLLMPVIVMILFFLRGLYRSRLRMVFGDAVVPVISAVSVGAMAVAMLGLFANGQIPTQSAWIDAWIFSLLGLGVARMGLGLVQRFARSHRLVGKPVLIMGAGMVGSQVARRLDNHPEYGLVPVGFLDEDPLSIAEVGGRSVPVLGNTTDLDEVVARTRVRNLIVAFSSVADARVSRLIQRCQELGVEVSVVPRMFDTINNRVGYDTVGGLPLMSFSSVDPKGIQFAAKHACDFVLAAGLLLVLSPILLAAVLAVRLSSPGPVLFRQRRVGRDGKVFDLYKFRSMRHEPRALAGRPAGEGRLNGHLSGDDATAFEFMLGGDTAPGGVEGDDRRTAVGRLLRRTSIDELPQLINVLRGEMSLIGPRPERPEFVDLFRQDIARYGDRHRVKSGITGWAQVHGLRGQTSLAERVEWDNYYIAHWSLGLDLKILALTLVALLRDAE
jgi:exopolysaccharide biosynthesis polyprenyl glycosylphosphotransferase